MSTIQARDERNVASEIVLMVWSDRMDVVALANVKGEVALHRLTWPKVWNLSPPKDGVTVKGIVWRPDGKIIAIAYSSGQTILVKVENKSILHTIETKNDISCLSWIQDGLSLKSKDSNEDSIQNKYMKYIDLSPNFLPEPVSQQFDSSSTDDNHKTNPLQDQSILNLLLVGTSDGIVYIQVFGCFPCATLSLKEHLNSYCSVESIHLTEGLNQMFITVRDSSNNVKLLIFNSNIFYSHSNELFAVAVKHIKLTSLLNYLSDTITTITESWESILLEMDNKLSKYASKVPEGGVTADFLDLLVFGICSEEMKGFLIHDLTKKGLEKFGQTIEMSYTNIQKLVQKYVMKFGQNISYHLAEMRGMARLEHKYKILGLHEDVITDAILSNGAFLIKGGEMQQIINHSIINYKAFFRWLYTAIVHVLEEQVPNEITKITQQDLAYITEFLQNFDGIGKNSKKKGFIMERLGQYLNNESLTIQPNMKGNEWTTFLAQNQCVQNSSYILKHCEEKSLIQQYKDLNRSIENIFIRPKDTMSGVLELQKTFICFDCGSNALRISQINIQKDAVVFCFLQPPESIFLAQVYSAQSNCLMKCARMFFTQDNSEDPYHILDIKLYSTTVLSVLLQENIAMKSTVLCQVPLTRALEKISVVENKGGVIFKSGDVVDINGSNLMPRLFKNVEGMAGMEFAVSGSRKVGIVLAENRRKVKLYEMEAEEEDDEDAEMTNNTLKEMEMSVQEINTL